ncbi:hypothetical protein DRQ18_01595 [bacterium]|nr:MAG: hypothetical protein DRQ18_01595 [bacterium]
MRNIMLLLVIYLLPEGIVARGDEMQREDRQLLVHASHAYLSLDSRILYLSTQWGIPSLLSDIQDGIKEIIKNYNEILREKKCMEELGVWCTLYQEIEEVLKIIRETERNMALLQERTESKLEKFLLPWVRKNLRRYYIRIMEERYRLSCLRRLLEGIIKDGKIWI